MNRKTGLALSLLLTFSTLVAGCQTASPQQDDKNKNNKQQTAGQNNKKNNQKNARVAGNDNKNTPEQARVHVQLLGINDFHGQLDVTRKFNNQSVGRADYLSAHINQRRGQEKNTLLVHAGDAVGASPPISALLQDEPTIEILNKMRFDVATVGNHEFDDGTDEMMRLINGGAHPLTGEFEGAQFPYVCANLVSKATGEHLMQPYVIKRVNGMPIGFIGIVLDETPRLVIPSGVAGVRFTDEVTAINETVADLKKQGVRSIVVLAHNPGDSAVNGENAEGELIDIAKKVDDEVDVIYGGHSHRHLNATVDNKLLVQSYSSGTHFSDIDLEIDPRSKNIVAKRAEIVPVTHSLQPDASITALINAAAEKVGPIINQVVGTAAQGITRQANEAGESALGNLIADAQRAKMKTDFAFMNPGGIRADLDAGPATWGELYTVQPFNNDLVTMNLTGAQIRTLLEQQWLAADKVRVLQISGLRYSWDPNRPAGNRVVDITLANGSPIDPAATYSVTANSFLASGGDQFTIFSEGTNRVVGPVDLDALVDYVKAQPQPFSAAIEGRIKKLP